MKKFSMILVSCFSLALGACGTQEPGSSSSGNGGSASNNGGSSDTSGTTGSGDTGGTTTVSHAAFRTDGPYLWAFNAEYLPGSPTTAEVRGNLTNMTWSSGVQATDSDGSGFVGMSYTVNAGTYELSYLHGSDWASYGSHDALAQMTSADRAFLQCNWWDSNNQVIDSVSNAGCDIRVTVDSAGNITAAGNMGNYDPSQF